MRMTLLKRQIFYVQVLWIRPMANLDIFDRGVKTYTPKKIYKTGLKTYIPKKLYTKTTYSPLWYAPIMIRPWIRPC
ncbi:hypothetical protein HanXRQr2_Chr12g0526101 [Helianthus annuus]|uniref:Uncharacterized protein n=1 Tax=Helianthus annuus TaxID=4232 RepID=A0A9K3HDN2_HELAN|nr:hypothetical protein HanXRQr2_Chr12g0526101 [Helianthus annuus]